TKMNVWLYGKTSKNEDTFILTPFNPSKTNPTYPGLNFLLINNHFMALSHPGINESQSHREPGSQHVFKISDNRKASPSLQSSSICFTYTQESLEYGRVLNAHKMMRLFVTQKNRERRIKTKIKNQEKQMVKLMIIFLMLLLFLKICNSTNQWIV
ncbi:hypothetical protein MAR_029749, partial [Mya arenaria]